MVGVCALIKLVDFQLKKYHNLLICQLNYETRTAYQKGLNQLLFISKGNNIMICHFSHQN
jgi:hypothetical protein